MSFFQSLQADDLDAINRFIASAAIHTTAGQTERNGWIEWYDTRSSWQKNFDRVTFDQARNRRLAFELANATTDAERADIQRVANEGLSSEQAQGEPDRRQSGGGYTAKDADAWGGLLVFALGIVGSAGLTAYFMRRR